VFAALAGVALLLHRLCAWQQLLLLLLLLLQVFGLQALSDILTVPVADLAAATQVGRGTVHMQQHAARHAGDSWAAWQQTRKQHTAAPLAGHMSGTAKGLRTTAAAALLTADPPRHNTQLAATWLPSHS
jgi:hypothetical protein